MNQPLYLGSLILDLSKTVICEFWYDYVKLKYRENAKPWYVDTDGFFVDVKTDDIYKDIAEDIDTFNFEIDRPLRTGKNKKVIGLMKDELVGQIMIKFVERANDEDKNAKGIEKCFIKRNLKFRDYKKWLNASQIENKINYLEKKII